MTEDQRIGQLFLLGLANNSLGPVEIHEIQADHIGSVWYVNQTSAGVSAIRSVSAAVQAQASAASTDNVRFFIAANQEGGLIQAMQGPGFSRIPSALTQGTLLPAALQAEADTWAAQLLAAGINLNFAPVMDVVPPGTDSQNQPIGALQREYGHEVPTVISHGTAFLRGMHQAGVAVTLKHFPGLGRVTGNTDYTGTTDTVTTETDPYLQSFHQGFLAGADLVMVSTATYTRIDPNHLAAFSPIVIGQMLRGSLDFKGVVVSDDLGAAAAVASIPAGQRGIDFLLAGGDLIISKTSAAAAAMVTAIRNRSSTDASFRARVGDAALAVLRMKGTWGLLPC
jgi:beta-N-acetylhexosaminidase